MRFKIGEIHLDVDIDATSRFYAQQPQIEENCPCGDCQYFQEELIQQPIRLLELLKQMGVNLAKQPNINPDGICCVSDEVNYKKAYIGYYMVIGNTQKEQSYTDIGDNSITEWSIKQNGEYLVFDFYIQYGRL